MKLGYTIIYVSDVLATLAFYEKAFGLKTTFVPESQQYGEMNTGSTTLAFCSEAYLEQSALHFRANRPNELPAGFEIAFVTETVDAAYHAAIEAGAIPVAPPKEKPWGQIVAYVRDLNGVLVELCSPIASV